MRCGTPTERRSTWRFTDADRHDQIDALATLKRLLDDDTADHDDIRDAAVQAVNQFDSSIAAHDGWRPYSRRGSSDPSIRAEADELGKLGVERHPEYRGRLRRRVGDLLKTNTIRKEQDAEPGPSRTTTGVNDLSADAQSTATWWVEMSDGEAREVVGRTRGRLVDAEMMGARYLASLRDTDHSAARGASTQPRRRVAGHPTTSDGRSTRERRART